MRKTDTGNLPAEAPIAAEPVPAPAEQQPSEGGSYVRLRDGTLQREEEG